MVNQLNIFLLLFGALQGALLSAWFFRIPERRAANTYFALLLSVVGLQLIFKVIAKAWLMDEVRLAYSISYRLPYLIGPLLYLYIKRRADNQFVKTDLVHFVPFTLLILLQCVAFELNWFHINLDGFIEGPLQMISLIGYGVAALRIDKNRLSQLIWVIVVTEIVVVIALALMRLYYGWFPEVRLFFVLLTFVIYWISFRTISEPAGLSGGIGKQIPVDFKKQKYAHSSLTEKEATRIETNLRKLMLDEKLYIDPGLTIDALAGKLSASRHHISQVLNENIGKAYHEYLNEFRLEEVCRRFADPRSKRYTVAAIAMDSGFSSISTFNESFRKRFGVTPSRYRDQVASKKLSA